MAARCEHKEMMHFLYAAPMQMELSRCNDKRGKKRAHEIWLAEADAVFCDNSSFFVVTDKTPPGIANNGRCCVSCAGGVRVHLSLGNLFIRCKIYKQEKIVGCSSRPKLFFEINV